VSDDPIEDALGDLFLREHGERLLVAGGVDQVDDVRITADRRARRG